MKRERDDTWLREAMQSYGRTLEGVARRYGLPEADIRETVYCVFEIAARKRSEIEHGCMQQYLCAIARRIVLTRRRSRERRRETYDSGLLEDTPDPRLSPEHLIDLRRACGLLREICNGLPQKQRIVFELTVFEGHTAVEVAALLGLRVPTVKSNLRRAWESFRERTEGVPGSIVLRELGLLVRSIERHQH